MKKKYYKNILKVFYFGIINRNIFNNHLLKIYTIKRNLTILINR